MLQSIQHDAMLASEVRNIDDHIADCINFLIAHSIKVNKLNLTIGSRLSDRLQICAIKIMLWKFNKATSLCIRIGLRHRWLPATMNLYNNYNKTLPVGFHERIFIIPQVVALGGRGFVDRNT